MSQEYIDRDYQVFYEELLDNCKELFIQDPQFTVYYDAMRHQDVVSWQVRAGSQQFDFFKDLFKCQETHYDDLAVREVEKKIYIPEYPNTLRECWKRAWVIIKMRFKHGR